MKEAIVYLKDGEYLELSRLVVIKDAWVKGISNNGNDVSIPTNSISYIEEDNND